MLAILRCLRHRLLRNYGQVLKNVTACLLILGIGLPASAVHFEGVFLSTIVMPMKSDNAKSVKAQTAYLYNLARKEMRSGNIQKGKALFQQVLTLDPMHAKAKSELRKLESAGVSLAAAPAMENLTAKELMDAAKAMMRDQQYADAEKTLQMALSKASNRQEKQQIQSYLDAINKQSQLRASAQEAELSYQLSEYENQLQKAMIYLNSGQFEKAEIEAQRATNISPDDKRAEKLLDQIYKAREKAQENQLALQKEQQDDKQTELHSTAEVLFREGVALYRQGQIIEAVAKWNHALEVYPDHQAAQTYLTNTKMEYEQAIAARQAAQEQAVEEEKYEEMLDVDIAQYSTQGELIDIKDVLKTLSAFSQLNLVMDDNLTGNVALEVKNTTLREILNLLQKQYGYVWKREGRTLYVEPGFTTRIFPLDEAQFKTIEAVLSDPSVLEDSSRNLKTILYGQNEEFNVPGKQLFLNQTTRSLVVTDTVENLRKVEAFLKEMPTIVGDKKPIVTRIYHLGEDVAKDIYEVLQLMLYEGLEMDASDLRRKLLLEDKSNVLIVMDYPENIERVDQELSQTQWVEQLATGELQAKQFPITDVDDVEDTPEALTRREEFVMSIADILEKMLYGKEGRDAARLQGRYIVPNPLNGTIDVVDSSENIAKVEKYLSSVRGESLQDMHIRSFMIKHVNVFDILDALSFIFYDNQQSTRTTFLSENTFQSLGTDEQGTTQDISNIFEQTSRERYNLQSGGGGGTDLLQFFALRMIPDTNTNSIIVITPQEDEFEIVQRIIDVFDKPQRMVEIESRVVTVSLTDLRAINFDYLLTNPLLEPINVDADNIESEMEFIQGDISSEENPGINLSLHTFGPSRLDFMLSLLESTSSMNTLAAPKLLSLPGSLLPPQFFVGQQIPYADDVTFEDQGDDDPTNNRLTADYQRVFTGVSLAVLPFILNDDHIYLEMAPQIIDPGERLPVGITGEAPAGQSIPNIGPLLLNQKVVQTSVRLKDGATVVLSGLIQEEEEEQLNKVPLISKIPFLGSLFTDRTVSKSKFSTLWFITARIIEPEF